MSATASFASSNLSSSGSSGDDNSTVLTDLLTDASIPWDDEDILTLTVRSSRLVELAQHVESLLRKLPANSPHGVAPLLINDFGLKPPNTPRVVRLIVDSDANPPIVQFLRQLFDYVQITGIRLNYEVPSGTPTPIHILTLADQMPQIATLKNMALCTNGCGTFLHRALAAPGCHLERLCISAHFENETPCFHQLAQALRLGVGLKSVRLYNIGEVSESNFVTVLQALGACRNLNRFVVEDLLLSFSLDILAGFVKDHAQLEILEVVLSSYAQLEAQEMMQMQPIRILANEVLASKTLKRVILPFWPIHSPLVRELIHHATRSQIEYLDLWMVKAEKPENSANGMLDITVGSFVREFEELEIEEDELDEWATLILEGIAEISHRVCSLSAAGCHTNNMAGLVSRIFARDEEGCAISKFKLDHTIPLTPECIQLLRAGLGTYSNLTVLYLSFTMPGDLEMATLLPESPLEEVTLALFGPPGSGEALEHIATLLQQHQGSLKRLKLKFDEGFGNPTAEEFAPFDQALQNHPSLTKLTLCGTSPPDFEGGLFRIVKKQSKFLGSLFESLCRTDVSLETLDLSEWGDSMKGWTQAMASWTSVKDLKLPEGELIRQSLENGTLLPALKQNMRICRMDARDDFSLEQQQELAKGLMCNQMVNHARLMADNIHSLPTPHLWPNMLAKLRPGNDPAATPVFFLVKTGVSSFCSILPAPNPKRKPVNENVL